ncbi:MAG: MCP four helix bundle domain-containing protein [Anaerolineaceae bacterium]|nr:MCP four helix bundle domain-containing protein [Anaerolineaceae bacterium]
MSKFNLGNVKTGVKLQTAFLVVVILMAIVDFTGYTNLNSINNSLDDMATNDMGPMTTLAALNKDLYDLRGNYYKYILIPSQRSGTKTTLDGDLTR